MSTALATFTAPGSVLAYQLYEQVARWLSTGSTTPAFSTAPAFRASSTATSTGTATTLNHTLSSSIVAGDFILLLVNTQTAAPVPPAGWSYISYNNPLVSQHQFIAFYKFAVAGDIGATITITNLVTDSVAISASYSGVWTAAPFNGGGQGTLSLPNVGGTNGPLPSVTTTVANTLVLQLWSGYNSVGAAATITTPATSRVTATGTAHTLALSEQSQAVAGATGAVNATASVTISWVAQQLVLQGVPTSVGAPAGGWTFVDQWTGSTVGGDAWWVWKSPAASTNVGSDWYIIFKAAPPGFFGTSGLFGVTSCELYSASTRIWNACATNTSNTVAADILSVSSSVPPWSQLETTTKLLGLTYTSQVVYASGLGAGTTYLRMIANADGFFMSTYAAGAIGCCIYIGNFLTLIVNPNITGEGGIVQIDLTSATNTQSATRDPGPTDMRVWASYKICPFWPTNQINGSASAMALGGSVAGSAVNNDLYQAPNANPLACRILVGKLTFNNGWGQANINGNIRCLLPRWLQIIQTAGNAWGDTLTEAGDSMCYVIGSGASNNPVWVDLAA